jgi:FtsZ-binding cell division protein ZapB
MAGVFEEAYSAVRGADYIVGQRIQEATAQAALLQTVALDTISALQNVRLDFVGSPPSPPRFDSSVSVSLDLPEITPTSFGSITSHTPSRPVLDGVPEVGPLNIPDFQSSISSLNIPEPPPWTAPGVAPDRPSTGDVVLPDAPLLAMPTMPALVDISIPDFAGLMLPTFDPDAPEFEGTALPGILQWSEPTYHTEILDEVLDVIRKLWAGGSGIPPAVEQAMIERALSREDMIANREIDSVAEEFSLRGFTMPTGMQAARVDQMRQDLALKKLSLNRELTIKFAEWQIENIRFGVQQAIAAENVFVNIFLNSAQRMFEAARFQIESQLNLYNAQVSLFNARMNGYQIKAQVFDTMVKAELSKVEVFKAEIEAEVARGQINEQKVRTYIAQVQALQTEVEIFKARMQGAQVQSDVIRNQIEAYKADVQAYAERIQADKVRFDAYESQVKGEAAKAGIIDAEARAYAALVQGKSAAADIDVKRAELIIQKNRSMIEAYIADLDKEKARIQSQVAVIQSSAQAYVADTQRFAAQAQAETAKAQVEVAAKEAELRTNVAFYQAQVQAYLGKMEQMIRQAAVAVDALKAAGQTAATLAAGAMAGVHVGATLTGSGAVSASGANSFVQSSSTSKSWSENHNYNYDGGRV